jgi:hypothetical protein
MSEPGSGSDDEPHTDRPSYQEESDEQHECMFAFPVSIYPVFILSFGQHLLTMMDLGFIHFFPSDYFTSARANARKKSKNYTFYVHELLEFPYFVKTLFATLIQPHLNEKWRIIANSLRTAVFELKYSIPCTSNKDISLDSVSAYEEMVQEAQTCHKSDAEVQLAMEELEVCESNDQKLYLVNSHLSRNLLVLV